MQKESILFFSFTSASKFGGAKVTKKTRSEQNKVTRFFMLTVLLPVQVSLVSL